MNRIKKKVTFPEKLRQKFVSLSKEFSNIVKKQAVVDTDLEEKVLLRDLKSNSNLIESEQLSDFLPKTSSSRCLVSACYHICITGSDGSGKSMALAGFIDDVFAGKVSQLSPGNDSLILVLNCHALESTIKVTDFIFGLPIEDINQVDVNHGIEWMKCNPTKVIFIVDDMDVVPFSSVDTVCANTNDIASPGVILKGIFDGFLFPGCTVLSTCHSDKFESLVETNDLRIVKSLTIQGLTQNAVRKIAKTFLGDKVYQTSFGAMKSSRPYAYALCENPTILLITLLGLKEDTKDPPRGLSGIFLRILNELSLKNAATADTLKKLALACYTAKGNGRDWFNINHLYRVGLSMSDMKNLQLNSCHFVKEYQIKNQNRFRFRHSIFLDGFAALHLYDFDRSESERSYKVVADNSSFMTTWQILSGFVADDYNLNLILNLVSQDFETRTRYSNDHKYKTKLINSYNNTTALRMLEEASELSEQLDALHLIAECGTTVKENIEDEFETFEMIPYGCLKLNQADSSALASCICLKGNMTKLKFSDCLLSSLFLEVLHDHIAVYKSNAKIDTVALNLRKTGRFATIEEASSLALIFEHVSEFCDLSGWRFDDEQIAVLQESLNMIQNPKLQVQLENGDIMSAQSTWSDFLEKEISSNGGNIELNDCGLKFPKGSLEKKSLVKLEMRNCATFNPDEYIPVTPSVHVDIYNRLQKKAVVNLTPWCYDEEEDDSCIVEIFRLEDDTDTWIPLDTVALVENMKFECQAFSSVRGYTKTKHTVKRTIFRMTGMIMAKQNTWCVIFLLNHKSTKKEAEEEMKRYHFECVHLPFNSIYTKVGGIIRVDIRVLDPNSLSFDGTKTISPRFKLTRRFLRNESYQLSKSYQLKCTSRRNLSPRMTAQFEVFLDGNITDNNSGTFEHDVTFQGTDSFEKAERIEDVFDDEIVPRFADAEQFFKFARSKDGFRIDLTRQSSIKDDYAKSSEQKLQMLSHWMEKNPMATASTLRRLVDNYFTRNPLAGGDERQLLRQAYDEVASRFPGCHDWLDFSRSIDGLNLSEHQIQDVIQGQQNITREQKFTILDLWLEEEGDSASAQTLKYAADRFDEYR